MRFSDIPGHKQQISRLSAMADERKIPHALLLSGPSGIGKTEIARAFIQYIYCTDRRNGDSCGKCPACIQTAAFNNPDVHYVYPIIKKSNPKPLSTDFYDEWKQFVTELPFMPVEKWNDYINAGNSQPMIYVTESEEILRLSSLSAYGNSYKVFLIWLPERMNEVTANKLLKVIEEPFEDTLFILVSNNPGQLLPTVRSRLQTVEFKALPEEEIAEFFQKSNKTAEEAAQMAKLARGNMNTAASLLASDGEMTAFSKDFMELMRAAYARKMPELRDFAEKFAAYGREKSIRLLDYFARMIRESFISNLKCEALQFMLPTEKVFVERFGPFINAANVEEIATEINRAREDISRNANQKIVWFDFFIELTRLIRTKGVQNKH